MPFRYYPIVTGEIYHVFNRSVAGFPIFQTKTDYQRLLELINFYRYKNPAIRFSHFKKLPFDQRAIFQNNLITLYSPQVEILAYCVMPNHFHFLLKQVEENGISRFIRILQNSYAKYFNTKNDRNGGLFQAMFKCLRIEDDEQLLHVARYIHLNPATAYLVHKIEDLQNYPWDSFGEYVKTEVHPFLDKSFLLSFFQSTTDFKSFTFDQVDYQRKLQGIKHLLFE